MVGLYETAVDELCSWKVNGKRVRPKVIASTATIRRAPDQVQKLFLRKLDVFPPQGTCIRDSFFAIQRPAGPEYPGRRYLGICAFGRRYPVAMIRSYVALMASAQVLYRQIRQAGRSVDDARRATSTPSANWPARGGWSKTTSAPACEMPTSADWPSVSVRALEELTSRKSGTDIPKILERLEAIFDKTQKAQREAERKGGQQPVHRRCLTTSSSPPT